MVKGTLLSLVSMRDHMLTGLCSEQVKTQFVSDPRYDAVPSSSLRESLFVAHLASLASGSSSSAAANVLSKAEKAAKAAASLKEREEQVRSEQQRSSRNATMARGAMGREEGQREFMSMLIDAVRDHEVSCIVSV